MADEEATPTEAALENLVGFADETNRYLARILEVLQSMNQRLAENTLNLPGE